MAANYITAELLPLDIGQPYSTVPLGTTFAASPNIIYPHQGFRMPHGVKTCIYRAFKIPAGGTVTTGITTEILVCCDPSGGGFNSDVTGTVAYFDVSIGTQTDGTSLCDDSEFTGGTFAAQTISITMPTAVGKLKKGSVVGTIANWTNANAAISAGLWCTLRIRRLGDSATDTNTGAVVVAGISTWLY
jgi:hypothetical protein